MSSRLALGPTEPPIQLVLRALCPGIKRPGCEAEHSSPPSAEVKKTWVYTYTLPIRLHGVVVNHRDFTLPLDLYISLQLPFSWMQILRTLLSCILRTYSSLNVRDHWNWGTFVKLPRIRYVHLVQRAEKV
jgi:hypothetical protein